MHMTEQRIAHAAVLNNLAKAFHRIGRHDEAQPLYQKVINIRRKELGEFHGYSTHPLINLALSYSSQGKFAEAEPLLIEAIRIDEAQPAKWEKQRFVPVPPPCIAEVNRDLLIAMKELRHIYEMQNRPAQIECISKKIENIAGRVKEIRGSTIIPVQ